MPPRKSSPKKKITTLKKKSIHARASTTRVTRTIVRERVACADFVGGDKRTINYGFTSQDVERLIDRVLAFLQAGATFLPYGARNELLRAELDGETLTFQAGATLQLAQRRNTRAYLLSLTVRREYQIWATKFIPLAARMDVKRNVDALDMPIAFSEFRVPREGSDALAQITYEPLNDITDALSRHAAFVILGEPGAGKTTTLQKIAFEQARHLLAGDAGRVPLLVRLSQQANREPFEFLRAEWERRTGTDFADALAAGRVLLLADGINELPRDERDERLKAWREFTSEYTAANQIVFTSRERDYDRQLDLPRVRVEPLDDARITDYLERNHVAGLQTLLDDPRSRVRDMARNPFNLSLLVSAYKSNQRDMANRGRLMEWFVGELFAREERLAHRGWLPREVQMRALAQLAFAMQAQGESTTLAFKTARELVPAGVEFNGDEVNVKPADLFRFARAATLLDAAVEPDVRFYHHLLQEYFAALELLRRFEQGEDLSALWQAKRLASEMSPSEVGEWDALPEPPATGWEVTTILACGLTREPARLIEMIRPHYPTLAARCLDESGIEKPLVQQHDEIAEYDESHAPNSMRKTAHATTQFHVGALLAVTERVRADLLADLNNPQVHLRARLQAGFALGRIGDPRFAAQTINGVQVILPYMVDVPAGEYVIGSADDDTDAYDNEKPQHRASLDAFRIGKYPVTNAEFACFIAAGGYTHEKYWGTELARRWLKGEDVAGGQFEAYIQIWQSTQVNVDWKEQLERTRSFSPQQLDTLEVIAGWDEEELKRNLTSHFSQKSRSQPHYWDDAQYNNPSQPVVCITWFEARAYCAWLTEVTDMNYRLPSEAEWEAATRGSFDAERARIFSWGDEWDATKTNSLEGRVLKPSPVGVYDVVAASPFGTSDQTGNVWDWTSTLYQAYPYADDGRENVEADGERVVRGGSFNFEWMDVRCAFRLRSAPDFFLDGIGFRVLSPGS